MSSTTWTFALTADGSFVPVTLAGMRRFLDGLDKLPSVEGVVYIADIYVELESRAASNASIYAFFKYKVGTAGRWDPSHKQDADLAWGELMSHLFAPEDDSKKDGVIGGERFAKRRVDMQHRWKPTDEQLTQISGAIVRRAKRAIPIRLFNNAPNRELT